MQTDTHDDDDDDDDEAASWFHSSLLNVPKK